MMLSAVLCVENVDKQELGQAVKSWMCGSVRACVRVCANLDFKCRGTAAYLFWGFDETV